MKGWGKGGIHVYMQSGGLVTKSCLTLEKNTFAENIQTVLNSISQVK